MILEQLDDELLKNLDEALEIAELITINGNNFQCCFDEIEKDVENLQDSLKEAYSIFLKILESKGKILKDKSTPYTGSLIKFPKSIENEEAA